VRRVAIVYLALLLAQGEGLALLIRLQVEVLAVPVVVALALEVLLRVRAAREIPQTSVPLKATMAEPEAFLRRLVVLVAVAVHQPPDKMRLLVLQGQRATVVLEPHRLFLEVALLMLAAAVVVVALLVQPAPEARAALVAVEMEQNHLLVEMVRPELQIPAAAEVVLVAQAAPALSFSR
jgi:hypothetical protein